MRTTPLHSDSILRLAAGILAFGTGAGVIAGEKILPYRPAAYSRIAQQSVSAPLEMQASRGYVLERTLWNHHFNAGTAELRPSGRALLNRLARRNQGACGEVFLQTAHDLKFDGTALEKFASARDELDSQRVKQVADYFQFVLRRDLAGIQIHDPNPVGMSAVEATLPYQDMVRFDAKGVLPPETTEHNFGFGSVVPAPIPPAPVPVPK